MQLKLSEYWLSSPSKTALKIYLILSLLLAIGGYVAVEISFASTKYPVSLFEGQLAFHASEIKNHYMVLQDQGTFSRFVQTQMIDFAWIIGLMLTLFFSHVLIARAQPKNSKWRMFALYLAVIAPAIAASDAIENFISFAMLADPQNFPDWLAPLYSGFAAIKWSWAAIGTTLIIIQISALAISNKKSHTYK